MDVDFAFICDYADVSTKINALGIGFDTVFLPQLPGVHRGFHLVLQLRASIVEAGQKELAIRVIDADGNNIIPPITGQFTVPVQEGAVEGVGRLAVALQNLEFLRQGAHSLHIVVQGQEMVRIPFNVVTAPTTG
jgi:hypothetical protein